MAKVEERRTANADAGRHWKRDFSFSSLFSVLSVTPAPSDPRGPHYRTRFASTNDAIVLEISRGSRGVRDHGDHSLATPVLCHWLAPPILLPHLVAPPCSRCARHVRCPRACTLSHPHLVAPAPRRARATAASLPSRPRRLLPSRYAGALSLATLEPMHFRLRALSPRSPASTTRALAPPHPRPVVRLPQFPSPYVRVVMPSTSAPSHARPPVSAPTAPMRHFVRALRIGGRVAFRAP
ncbi:hypothetical protein DENSPDRAFT_885841 [Dentipellis sp. KUC8613]|nr:hypothetical protein DENSPDRAFT_885841 [Dentipellis sp. KUC8613]